MKKKINFSSSRIVLLIGIVVTIVASIPLFMQGLWQNGTGHDIFFHLMRIEGLSQGLASGQFPVKIQPDWYHGYGYATSIFYGDLFLYFPALLYLAGLPLEVAYKLFVILCNAATFYVAYYSIRGIFNKEIESIIAAIWYTLSLYRMIDVYIRHAVGEHTAMIFLPLVGYAMFCLLKEIPQTSKGWHLLTIGMSGILQSHIISLEICVGILVVICLIYIKRVFRKETILGFFKAVGATIGINLWFLVPFVDYMKTGSFNANTVSEYKMSINIQQSGILLKQLFGIVYHASGINLTIDEGIENEMPLGVGFSGVIILVIATGLVIHNIYIKKKSHESKLMIMLLSGSLLALWMSTYYFPWEKISSIHKAFRYAIVNIQFPWRFLGFASVFLAFLLAAVLLECEMKTENESKSEIKSFTWTGFAIICVCFTILLASDYTMLKDETKVSTKVSVKSVEDLDTSLESGEEYLPYGTLVSKLIENDIGLTNVNISSYSKNGLEIVLSCENKSLEEGYILLPLLCYKGYHAYSNSNKEELLVTAGDNNRLLVIVPAGFEGQLLVKYKASILWRLADWMSLACIIAFAFAAIRKQSAKKEK